MTDIECVKWIEAGLAELTASQKKLPSSSLTSLVQATSTMLSELESNAQGLGLHGLPADLENIALTCELLSSLLLRAAESCRTLKDPKSVILPHDNQKVCW